MNLVSSIRFLLTFSYVLTFCSYSTAEKAIEDEWNDIARVVAIGDIHGSYKNYIQILNDSDLIDDYGSWIGKDTHLVQVGDLPDRGPDTVKIIKHLQKLEKQAVREGGMIHLLIGNHEFMNVIGDLRYVHTGEYEAFVTPRSAKLRDAYRKKIIREIKTKRTLQKASSLEMQMNLPNIDEAFIQKLNEKIPLGYVEHRLAWQPGGKINSWIAKHNAVIKINDMLFLHAGLGPSAVSLSIQEINERIRAEILGQINYKGGLGNSQDGPLWYRGLAMNLEQAETAHLEELLKKHAVKKIIIGHTPSLGVITPRFGSKVLIIDTGISEHYGGHRSSLIIENNLSFASYDGRNFNLPTEEQDMAGYFQEMVNLKPDSKPLKSYLRNLLSKTTHSEGKE
tara:strand:+ start:949 stop:2130 length:1182 start_codon:yes stop_codon:yes gene_type:complete